MDKDLDELLDEKRKILRRLRGFDGESAIPAALSLLKPLRDKREHEALMEVAEATSRLDPMQATARRFYAQALIETGKVTAALDVLAPLVQRLPAADPEAPEAAGLIGRAYKQMFFDSSDRGSASAQRTLVAAITAYRRQYEADRVASTWHGVNLLALLVTARQLRVRIDGAPQPDELARELYAILQAVPVAKRDEWYLPTLAEVALGLDNWKDVASILQSYVASPDVQAFQLSSTLRQFTKVWSLEDDADGRAIVNILRARLLQLPGGHIELAPDELQRARIEPRPAASKLEAILGSEGAKTFSWWEKGLKCARSVASIRQKLGDRVGTGFAVRAADFGLSASDQVLVLTNFHVVNEHGADKGIQPNAAEVVFEAVDPNRRYRVAELIWSSATDQCDAALLMLDAPADGVAALELAKRLPLLDTPTRVYVIGHPGGRELAFSLQDNELLDHEGPPNGKPPIPGVARIHYRAPTEGGSSGSPVFNAHSWEVIGLHHKGGKDDMPRLNGGAGSYSANEGIAIQSVISAFAARSRT